MKSITLKDFSLATEYIQYGRYSVPVVMNDTHYEMINVVCKKLNLNTEQVMRLGLILLYRELEQEDNKDA